MAEQHEIAGAPRGEPLAAGRRGVRVRIPLAGTPSAHWSHVLSAQLHVRLTGRGTGRHLRLDGIVQGADVVLAGVRDEREASELGRVLREAVDATNAAVLRSECPWEPNADQAEADAVAAALGAAMQPAPLVPALETQPA